jgi:hypothetical protein
MLISTCAFHIQHWEVLMLSRTARFAAILCIASAGLLVSQPRNASAAAPFQCGDDGQHICCVDGGGACPAGQSWCCAFNDRDLQFCNCAGLQAE